MHSNLTGKLLIAMPSIGDSRFKRSVILVCAHNEDYAMGLVLNKPMDGVSLPDLLTQLGIETDLQLANRDVLDGGPVGTDRGFVLHSEDYQCDGATMDVSNGICLTATRDVLHAIASDNPPSESILALGYSGWGPGQLELELRENAWIVGEPTYEILFGEAHEDKWTLALDAIGVKSGRLQSVPGRA